MLGLEFGVPNRLNGFIQAGYGVNESPKPNKNFGNRDTKFFTANRLHVTAGLVFPLSFK